MDPADLILCFSNVGKHLEYIQEELEKYLEKLNHIFFNTEARKRDGHHDQKSLHCRSADVMSETKEHSGKEVGHSASVRLHKSSGPEQGILLFKPYPSGLCGIDVFFGKPKLHEEECLPLPVPLPGNTQFHHRDPGIVGLLTSDKIPAGRRVFYGMISDGIHTNPAALRIAHRAHPKGLVLVTDAIAGMGLAPGRHTLGQQVVEIDGLNTYIAGTKTLSGSVATMDTCVRHFQEATGCSVETALEAASLHPAQLLGIEHKKGTLNYDSDADFLMLNDSLYVQATYIAGEEVWRQDVSGM